MLRLCAVYVLLSVSTSLQPQVNIASNKYVQLKYPPTSVESTQWAIQQNLDSRYASTHSLFREVADHLRSSTAQDGSRVDCLPFLMRRDSGTGADSHAPIIEFTSDDLKSALACDYLDACTSTGRNAVSKSGWRMEGLHGGDNSQSFQSKRLDWVSVLNSQNTVVFNSAGAYISSQLAPTSLAALRGLDCAATGVCLNLYVTKADIRQSAPPHTDKQDVVVVQTQGRKRWRVYSPPNCALKCNVDPFCRGKGEDELTVPMLGDEGSELLLDVMLLPGDVLFVPARFPHTTDTLECYKDSDDEERIFGTDDWSIHLTLGLDSHVWAMNWMSMRTLALRRFGIHDVLKSNDYDADPDRNMDRCVGKVNQLSCDLREGLFSSLDETLFSPQPKHQYDQVLDPNAAKSASNLLAFHERTNFECGWIDQKNTLTLDQCLETVTHFRTIGQKIINTHEDMYIAALKEERNRRDEKGGWAMNVGNSMEKGRSDRLSIFRVPVFFEHFDKLLEELRAWGDQDMGTTIEREALKAWDPLPVILRGDQVEVNLGVRDDTSTTSKGVSVEIKSSWLFAKVVAVRSDGLFNLQLFDGTVKTGVKRHDIKGPHGIGIFI